MTNSDVDEGKESPEGIGLGQRVLDESQSDGQDSGLRGDEYVNGGHRRELTAQNILQVQQQQSQGAEVNWERFLHVGSIKVLLVENDDCTRHIVTALLRNCSYGVIEAVHGAQAWKILEDLNNQVDLVLTEVVTPCLSGVGLLYKIMNHRTRKNIPVIMMSSHDSMGLVFNCLSKGAVDFLVKPIRKNELKNLWQHVWRRCHSSSGSGSVSGTQTQKSVHTNNSEKSDDNSSNYGENNGSDDLNNVDESDVGSGSQSSWTKKPLPTNSSQAPSSTNQVAKCPDIKSEQVFQPNLETSSNKRVDIAAKNQGGGEDQCGYNDPLPDIANHLDSEPPADIRARVTGAKPNNLFESPSNSCSSRMKKVDEDPRVKLHGNKLKVIDIASSHSQMVGRELEPPKELTSRQLVENDPMDNPSEKTIELSLKRLRGINGSDPSAFSRYNTSTSAPQGITGSSYRNGDSLEDGNKDSLCVHANGNLVFPVSVSSNNIDMGSMTRKSFVNPLFLSSEFASTVNVAFLPVKNDTKNTPQLASQHVPVSMQASSVLSPTSGVHLGLQIQHTDVHYHEHHYHHYHTFVQEQKLPSYEKSSMKISVTDAGHSGLLDLNAMVGYEVGDPDNCCLNTSVRDSNYGSNGGHGSSSDVNAGLNHGDSGAVDGRNEGRDANGMGVGNRVDESKSAQREAAVLKFLQKRKERCFKKKVRYQNRKRLAEQRPRVGGQFVRQTDNDSSYEADE